MKDDPEQGGLSRRALLAGAAALGAGAFIPARALLGGRPVIAAPAQAVQTARDALETLTAAEGLTLEAITARLIPTDADGPGAVEARAARYIDRALGGALAESREAYRKGLAAVDAYARTSKAAAFAQLGPGDQDAVLRDMEANVATGFDPDAAGFFNLVRTHTIQGTFSDPFYGGNANFAGWDLIGYPGIRLSVSAADQRMDPLPKPVRQSAYDHAMFAKKRPRRARITDVNDRWRLS